MTGDESPLARWSRRKLAERSGPSRVLEEEKPASVETVVEVEARIPAPPPVEDEQPPIDEEVCEPTEPFPRVEDLTPESDLSAFFRKGVPKALRTAALRKMWSLDPSIRDHVGPAEYAWDFNRPGSMGGFSPLDAKDRVVDFLSKAGRLIASDGPDASPEAHLREAADPPSEEPVESAAESRGAGDEDAGPPSTVAPAPTQDGTQIAAGANEPDEAARQQETIARQRHGGAMPR